jgi:hypothetical protein
MRELKPDQEATLKRLKLKNNHQLKRLEMVLQVVKK